MDSAAEETGLTADLLKRDMGRLSLSLAMEQEQAECLRTDTGLSGIPS